MSVSPNHGHQSLQKTDNTDIIGKYGNKQPMINIISAEEEKVVLLKPKTKKKKATKRGISSKFSAVLPKSKKVVIPGKTLPFSVSPRKPQDPNQLKLPNIQRNIVNIETIPKKVAPFKSKFSCENTKNHVKSVQQLQKL